MISAASIEERLLLDCARIGIGATEADRIRSAVQREPDWKRFALLAERHRVTPLVCKTLERFLPDVFKLPELEILAQRTRFIAGRTLQLTQEMLKLVNLLEGGGIAVVPLKGSVLAVAAFGSLSSREFADVDLLVRPKDLNRACKVLQAAGYEAELELQPHHEGAYLRSEHSFTYHRDRNRLTVEIHWRLQDRYLSFPLLDEDLWANVQAQKLFGRSLTCLKPELNFIFLCMHGAKHSWDRLEWISCLHALAYSQPGDWWPRVVSEAARLKSTRLLHLGLLLVDQLGSSPSTRIALSFMPADAIVDDLAATVWERIFADEATGSQREVYRFRFYSKARERLFDRVRVLWNVTVRIPHPNSSSWQRTRLPASLLFLYYFLSPLGFLMKFGLSGLQGMLLPQPQPRSELWQEQNCGTPESERAGCDVFN